MARSAMARAGLGVVRRFSGWSAGGADLGSFGPGNLGRFQTVAIRLPPPGLPRHAGLRQPATPGDRTIDTLVLVADADSAAERRCSVGFLPTERRRRHRTLGTDRAVIRLKIGLEGLPRPW
jgi:hypothetical protein